MRNTAKTLLLVSGLCATVAVSALAGLDVLRERERFVTWEGIGPDKWAAVWLIRRHVAPEAGIEFLPAKSPIDRGVPFDVPAAALRRTASSTTFEKIVDTYAVEDPGALELAAIIREIEIGAWSASSLSRASEVERAYRQMQRRHGREQVSFPCYLQFFDNVYRILSNSSAASSGGGRPKMLPNDDCDLSRESPSGARSLVAELAARAILARMARGDHVVFVDTRENAEYDEGHIPGAINLKLREIDAQSAKSLAEADLVVPYCVKDFRGFEVARALQNTGIHRVAIMNPYGIRGWNDLGLPVVGPTRLTVAEAARELDACLDAIDACLRAP